MRVVYLHGFASSARSSKAAFFAAKLAASGVTLETPDLNEPDFSTLTVTRMVDQVRREIDRRRRRPVVLIGSSLGAFVAVQVGAAAARARVDRLVLLAPALDFGGNRMRDARRPSGSRSGRRPNASTCSTTATAASCPSTTSCTRTPAATTRSTPR